MKKQSSLALSTGWVFPGKIPLILPTTCPHLKTIGFRNNSHNKSSTTSAGGELLTLLIHQHTAVVLLLNYFVYFVILFCLILEK